MSRSRPEPRLIDWQKVRAAYEAGEIVIRLAQLYSVKAATIRSRAAVEGWPMSAGEERFRALQEQKRAAREKRLAGTGVLRGMDPEKRQAMMLQLLQRYAEGDPPEEFCRELGASRQALYWALFGDAGDEAHHSLVSQALISRIARADAALEAAEGPYEISRAREMCRFYRLDLERRRPALYGQQQRVEHTHTFDLGERLRRARERVVEVQPVEALPAPAAESAGVEHGEVATVGEVGQFPPLVVPESCQ